jgi:hypothetical protein
MTIQRFRAVAGVANNAFNQGILLQHSETMDMPCLARQIPRD